MASIKNELIGSWKLLSYIELPINGTDSLFPMGQQPDGILMYSPDGYMSVQIAGQQRPTYTSDDWRIGSCEEHTASVSSYISFSGTYRILENRIVSYEIKTSLFPNWKGQTQERTFDFEGDILYLKSVEPQLSNGMLVHAHMTWKKNRKAETNAEQGERTLHLQQSEG
ncbi:lipocalin-like domain-containing protein [Sphingobacterium sp. SYP-B4668]|uniref:lipocalin-like domain-containing protein n=1 Tax=Sphingobacterium sp. SYP-B4668 TaxID=2996035 RepID=UPI0022DCF97B|nr:lipocalin-like domain-containing protein [Sphingobacterium sp. SYP-B4668]